MEGIDFLSALVELETFWMALTLKSCEMKTFLFGPGDKIKKTTLTKRECLFTPNLLEPLSTHTHTHRSFFIYCCLTYTLCWLLCHQR